MLIWRESSCLVFASHRKVFANQGDLGGAERLARGWSDCPIIFQIIWLADYFGLETSPQDYYRLASGRVVSGCFSSYIRLFLAVNLDFRFGSFSFKEDVIVNCQATSFVNLHRIYFGGLKNIVKIPSEMEVVPRYNCWNCWHCWHCWPCWHCSTLFDTVDMTYNE